MLLVRNIGKVRCRVPYPDESRSGFTFYSTFIFLPVSSGRTSLLAGLSLLSAVCASGLLPILLSILLAGLLSCFIACSISRPCTAAISGASGAVRALTRSLSGPLSRSGSVSRRVCLCRHRCDDTHYERSCCQ